VIDASAYYKFELQSKYPSFADLDEIGRLTWAQSMDRHSGETAHTGVAGIEAGLDMGMPGGLGAYGTVFAEDSGFVDANFSPLTDDQCLLCVPTVNGFNIEKKEWSTLAMIINSAHKEF